MDQLFDQWVDAVVFCDGEGVVVYANAAAGRMLERAPDAVVGRRLWELGVADAERLREAFARVARDGAPRRFESFDARSGRWTHHDVYRVEGRICVVARDISGEKHAAARLQILADSLPALVALVDRAERYLFANAAIRKWFGVDPGSIVGRKLEEVVGAAAYAAIAPHVATVLSGEPVSFRARLDYASGGGRDVQSTYTPYVVDGRIEGFVALVADVSEAERMQVSLRSAIAARDEFISIASHELRTPLTALGLQLETLERGLERDAASDERTLKRVRTAVRQTDRLTTLVESLLNVSRISLGAFWLELEEFDLATLVREVVGRFSEEAARAGCELALRAPGAARGYWDRALLEQALINLIANALKYGPGKPVDVDVEAGGETITVLIRDRGIGISADDMARIFGRFERAVPSRHYGGLGLGLYITRQIVEAHGGSIEARSEPGLGSLFTISMARYTRVSAEEASTTR